MKKVNYVSSSSYGTTDSTTQIVPTDANKLDTGGSKFYIYLISCFAAMGGLLFGYDTGIISGSMLLIRPHFSLNTLWTEGIVSATIGAAAIFSIVAGVSADYLGRRMTILLASSVFTVGALVMGAAPSKEVLLGGRILVGAGIGFASMVVPLYIAEAAPANIRGQLVSINQLFITIGIVISALTAGAFSLLETDGWRYMLGLAAVPAVIQFVGFIFLPESPRWLVAHGRAEEAKLVLEKLRGTPDVDQELSEIQANLESDREHHSGGTALQQILKTPHVRKAVFVGGGLQLFAQLCGINTVIYYSGTILQMAGFPAKYAIWLVMVPNSVNFLATFIGLYLVERIGRKVLTIASSAGVVFALAVLAVGFQLSATHSPPINRNITEFYENGTEITGRCQEYNICEKCIENNDCGFCYVDDKPWTTGSCLEPSTLEKRKDMDSEYGRCNDTDHSDLTFSVGYCPTNFSWMAILGLALFLLAFAPGLGPMPWTINSEIFPLWARGSCIAITTAVNWICNLIVSFSFLTLTETITKHGTYWLFAGVCSLGIVFTIALVPETKGKTLEQVEELFMSQSEREKRRKQTLSLNRDADLK